MTLTDPPADDEIEVSVFGPGRGEAIAVHLGAGDWIIVDSCIHRDTKQNAVLEYLEGIGLPLESVRLVVPSHAHDDHIADITSIIRACPDAVVAPPIVGRAEEFLALLEQDVHFDELAQSVYRECRGIHTILEERRAATHTFGYRWAMEERTLWGRPAAAGVPGATVQALSPSDRAIELTKAEWGAAVARPGEIPVMPQVDPNTVSVALWVEVGDVRVLLGSDLENGPAHCGWDGVLAFVARVPRSGGASAYKVAHHGSRGAHQEDAWAQLLIDRPAVVLAPFRNSRLPRPEDAERICRRTEDAWITANPGFRLGTTRSRQAAAAFSDITKKVWEADRRAGHVRLRMPLTGADSWAVAFDPPARRLCP
jgi:beta-lactamase superfamily II metal-dependent hydrolase